MEHYILVLLQISFIEFGNIKTKLQMGYKQIQSKSINVFRNIS